MLLSVIISIVSAILWAYSIFSPGQLPQNILHSFFHSTESDKKHNLNENMFVLLGPCSWLKQICLVCVCVRAHARVRVCVLSGQQYGELWDCSENLLLCHGGLNIISHHITARKNTQLDCCFCSSVRPSWPSYNDHGTFPPSLSFLSFCVSPLLCFSKNVLSTSDSWWEKKQKTVPRVTLN